MLIFSSLGQFRSITEASHLNLIAIERKTVKIVVEFWHAFSRTVHRYRFVGLILVTGLLLGSINHFVLSEPTHLHTEPPHSPQARPTAAHPAKQPGQLVDIQQINPNIRLDIRYATKNNFVQQKLYQQPRCLLRPHVADRLSRVQQDLEKQGLRLKVFDCYRPLSVQKKLWKILPDPNYVADPSVGSRHNRGSAVDLSLVDREGDELEMPTEFDSFSPKAHLDYMGGSAGSRQNRDFLQQVMKKQGFLPLQTEWWHFDDPDWKSYPVLDIPLDAVQP